VLPVAERYGMGTIVWSPLAQGMLTGRVRKGQQTDLRRANFFSHISDEHRIDVVEQLIPVADDAGITLTHLAMASAIAYPGVMSALIDPARWSSSTTCSRAPRSFSRRCARQDRRDRSARHRHRPPRQAYDPPAIQNANLRRRPTDDRTAA